jgi:hypothetical protein
LVKRSPRTCGVDAHPVAVAVYFCAPELPSAAFEEPVVLDPSFDIGSSAPGLMLPHTEPISFGMD